MEHVSRAAMDVLGNVRKRVQFDTGDESIVQQHLANDADVNVIVRRFGLVIDSRTPPSFAAEHCGDFTGITDYASALEAVERAERGFMALPAAVRDRLDNDPRRLFMLSAEQLDELDASMKPALPVGAVTEVTRGPGGPTPQPVEPVPPKAE